MVLEELDVRTALHGMLSLTELEMRFRNPRAEIAEGRFTCVLPAGATISRFAKEVNGALMEGEVVERMRANRIYDEILHGMRDPALLEQDQGNRFSARVFPIEPKGTVRLVLSYTELVPAVDGVRTHVIPLAGLPRVARFSFHALLAPLPGEGDAEIAGIGGKPMLASRVFSWSETDWVPEDLELDRLAAPAGVRLLRAGDFYLASFIPPPAAAAPSSPSSSWLLYVDTSASAAAGGPHRVEALEELLGSLPPGDAVEIVAFDQSVATLLEGSAGDASRRIAALLRERKFLGGTDLAAAVRDAARRAATGERILFVTDGVATMGATELRDLSAAAASIPAGATVHAVVLGSAQSAETLRALTRGRGRVATVPFTASMEESARDAARLVQAPLGQTIAVRDAAAEWVYPAALEDVRPEREVFAVGKLKGGRAPEILLSAGAPEGFQVLLPAEGFETLLEREAYRAYIEYLREREAAEDNEGVRNALAQEQVRVSIERRILIPRTTLLVLESEGEYARFNLDRRALASILTIGLGGIEEVNRAQLPKTRFVPRKRSNAVAEEITVVAEPDALQVESGVEGGVAGGVLGGIADEEVEGGVVGGVAGAQMAPVEAPPPPPRPITVTAQAPSVQRPAEARKRDRWRSTAAPTDRVVAELAAAIEKNPLDRVAYNALGEARVARREWSAVADLALRWQPYDPENPQVYEILSDAALHLGRREEAVRAAGSLVEIAPAKPELLQRAGLLLLRIAESVPPEGAERARLMELAEAPLRRAVAARPDRVNAHRHLALLLWRAGNAPEAARVLEEALGREYPEWYGDAKRVMREELGWIYRALLAADPSASRDVAASALRHGVDLGRRDALRVTVAWETDANDVDLHVIEPSGEECWFSNMKTATLELYGDVTQGFGPEVIRGARRARGTYRVGVDYYEAGPMGVARGIAVILQARGESAPAVEIVPFRLVTDGRGADVVEIARVE